MDIKTLQDLHKIADQCPYDFYNAHLLADVDGFLGTGADLSPPTLLHAYRSGVFPWFNADDPICWWSPNPRCVINPSHYQPAKSLVRTAKKSPWMLSVNTAFDDVVQACSQPRKYSSDTWIHQEIKDAYQSLYHLGAAFSIEIWSGRPLGSELIGGLYGVNLGAIFFGESMFHTQTDASKMAFWGLMQLTKNSGIKLVDCQLENPHLISLGASTISRDVFLERLSQLCQTSCQGILRTLPTRQMAVAKLPNNS